MVAIIVFTRSGLRVLVVGIICLLWLKSVVDVTD